MAGELPFIEDLVKRFTLLVTSALELFRASYSEKVRATPAEFYLTPTMRSSS